MTFDEYRVRYAGTLLHRSAQSETVLVNRDGRRRVGKHYPSALDRCKEELAYHYVRGRALLTVPAITFVGADFIEFEYIESTGEASIVQTVHEIAQLYTATHDDSLSHRTFASIALSSETLASRLEYLNAKLRESEINEPALIRTCSQFLATEYEPTSHRCLVHGDLKSAHVLMNGDTLFFIDLALMSIASPWYDLAFYYIERADETDAVEALLKAAQKSLSAHFDVSLPELRQLLRASAFNRLLYLATFTCTHARDPRPYLGKLSALLSS